MAGRAASTKARAAGRSDERLIGLFLDMLAAERGAQSNTLLAYRRDLEDFCAHLAAARRTVTNASTDQLRRYLGELARRGLSAATVARRLSAIRQLYRFLYAEGQRGDDPAAVLEGPKRTRPLPKTLSIADVDRLLRVAAACEPGAPLPRRLRAPRRARHRGARQGQQGTDGAAQRCGQALDADLSGVARRSWARDKICAVQMAVPVVRRERTSDAPASRARAQSAGRRRRPARRSDKPARAAPRLRQPFAAQRCRPARGADAARPRGHFDDSNLHARARGAAEESGPRPASHGRWV